MDNALPATRRALAGADVPAARSALRAQVSYLKIVRDTLKLQTGDGQLDRLGGASARLVDRLEQVDAAVPRASQSVGGARKLKAWAIAELAVPTAPVTTVAPTFTPAPPAPMTTPAPTVTPTPTPTSTPPPFAETQGQPQPLRPRLRERRQLRRSLREAVRLPGA